MTTVTLLSYVSLEHSHVTEDGFESWPIGMVEGVGAVAPGDSAPDGWTDGESATVRCQEQQPIAATGGSESSRTDG